MTEAEQTKCKLIERISKAGDRYGDLLIECMDRFNVTNTQQLTVDMLQKFIKDRNIR